MTTDRHLPAYRFLTAMVFIWGIALRSPEIASGNYLFGFDQGWNHEIARSILEGKHRLIGAEVSLGSGIAGLFHGPGYYYLLALVTRLWRGDPYGSLVWMYLSGVGVMAVSYLLARMVWGRRVALLVLVFVATGPSFIAQSRFLWSPHPTTLLFLLMVAVLLKARSKPIPYLPMAVFLAVSVYHFHLGVAAGVVMSVIVYALFVRWPLRYAGICAAAASIAALPAILFAFRHGLRISGAATGPLSMINPAVLAEGIGSHLRDYWYNYASTYETSGVLSSPIFMAALLILSVGHGLRAAAESPHGRAGGLRIFFAVSVLASWTTFLFLQNTIWDYYLLPLHVSFSFLASSALVWLWDRSKSLRVPVAIVGVSVILSITWGTAVRMHRTWTSDYPDSGGTQKIIGKRSAVDWIYRDAGGRQFNAIVFMPPVYTYPYDYLFSWYGKERYGSVPGKELRGLVYLLIEPDPFKPWSHKGWLETVIGDRPVGRTVTLPSGHIIEKRMYP